MGFKDVHEVYGILFVIIIYTKSSIIRVKDIFFVLCLNKHGIVLCLEVIMRRQDFLLLVTG